MDDLIERLTAESVEKILASPNARDATKEIIHTLSDAHGATLTAEVLAKVLHALGYPGTLRVRVRH